MKKIVSIIALTLGAGVAFAVTDAQKTAFVEKSRPIFCPQRRVSLIMKS